MKLNKRNLNLSQMFASTIVLLLLAIPARAYIPPYWMILMRTAKNHGNGAYIVNEDVSFPNPSDPTQPTLAAHEHWIILSGSQMRVEVDGIGSLKNQLQLTYVYRWGRRYFISKTGVRKVKKAPNDWLEPFFNFRNAQAFQRYAIQKGVTPPASAASRQQPYSKLHPLPIPEPYMRLSRVDGTVSYAIGKPTPVGATLLPGLWIKQDQFVVKKIRFPSGAVVLAKGYNLYGDIWLPKSITVTWPNQSATENGDSGTGAVTAKAQLTLLNVTAVRPDKLIKKLMDPFQLSIKNGDKPRLMPNNAVIQSFYTKLR